MKNPIGLVDVGFLSMKMFVQSRAAAVSQDGGSSGCQCRSVK